MISSVTRRVRRIVFHTPVDCAVLVVYLAVANLVLTVGGNETGTVVAFVIAPLVLFLPGYAALTALFPRTADAVETASTVRRTPFVQGRGIDFSERIALSFVCSVAGLPFVVFTLSATGIGLTRTAIIGTLTVLIGVGLILGTVRRLRYPTTQRYSVSLAEPGSSLRAFLFWSETRTGRVVTGVMVGAVCLWVVSFGYLMLTPASGDTYSELTLLTEDENGEYVAADYPREFAPNESRPLTVAVENREGHRVEYTLFVQLQRVERRDGELRVREWHHLDRLSASVDSRETWTGHHEVVPKMRGRNLRLAYLLYRGTPPKTRNTSNAYRTAYIWINVTNPTAGGEPSERLSVSSS